MPHACRGRRRDRRRVRSPWWTSRASAARVCSTGIGLTSWTRTSHRDESTESARRHAGAAFLLPRVCRGRCDVGAALRSGQHARTPPDWPSPRAVNLVSMERRATCYTRQRSTASSPSFTCTTWTSSPDRLLASQGSAGRARASAGRRHIIRRPAAASVRSIVTRRRLQRHEHFAGSSTPFAGTADRTIPARSPRRLATGRRSVVGDDAGRAPLGAPDLSPPRGPMPPCPTAAQARDATDTNPSRLVGVVSRIAHPDLHALGPTRALAPCPPAQCLVELPAFAPKVMLFLGPPLRRNGTLVGSAATAYRYALRHLDVPRATGGPACVHGGP